MCIIESNRPVLKILKGGRILKLKKVLAVLFTCVMVLTMSSSAFASDVQPRVIGIGDTKETAITINSTSEEHNLYLSNAKDQDWFKWTNNTGKAQLITAILRPSGDQCHFRLGMRIEYADGKESSTFYAETGGGGFITFLHNIYVPEGAAAYMVVDSTYYAMEQYKLSFRVN